ncbi:MAG TPA: hypothetical protein VFQ36_09460 [Ktedonobacteraceae bacterium]|nr:hypothetical protein [Ktedonobacteraceae bacterium]
MATTFSMNPERVAYFEAAGWRAYYDRRWFKMAWLIVGLCQEQFRIPFPMSLLAAYYTARASAAWVPVYHDERKVLNYLRKFYGIARQYSGLQFDARRVAALELRYFEVHRRLSGQPEKEEFLQSLIDLHCAIFDLTPEQARESAQWRLQAATTVDRITNKSSTNIEGAWARLEEDLRRCYRSIEQERQKREPVSTK